MFNVFLSDLLANKAEKEAIQQKRHLKTVSAQSKLRERLVRKNRLRVEKRVIEMSADPVPIKRHEYSINFPSFKGECFIRQRPKDAKERIKDAEFSNTWLDTVPLLPSPHNFRPRLKEKEIHLDMKFTPKDRYERVTDTWITQRGLVNSSWEVKSKLASRNSENMTERFPNTLKKSYYKTVESLAMNIGPAGKPLTLPQVKTRGSEIECNEEGNTNRTLSQLANEVMDKCKLRPQKNELISAYASRSASLPGSGLKPNFID